MSPAVTEKTLKAKAPGNGKDRAGGSDRNGFSGEGGRPKGLPLDKYRAKLLGLWLLLATITMFFASITSALVIRRSAPDWTPIYFPNLFWLTTGLLLLSSATLEVSRHSLKNSWNAHRIWLGITTILGLLFLAGQIGALRVLASHGLFLPTNPHSSFFYLITCLHGLHLLGGVLWMSVAFMGSRIAKPVPEQDRSLKLLAVYWHFLDLLWIYLLVLLLVM